MPGHLELTAKFSELPRPLPVSGGIKIETSRPKRAPSPERAASQPPNNAATICANRILRMVIEGKIIA